MAMMMTMMMMFMNTCNAPMLSRYICVCVHFFLLLISFVGALYLFIIFLLLLKIGWIKGSIIQSNHCNSIKIIEKCAYFFILFISWYHYDIISIAAAFELNSIKIFYAVSMAITNVNKRFNDAFLSRWKLKARQKSDFKNW